MRILYALCDTQQPRTSSRPRDPGFNDSIRTRGPETDLINVGWRPRALSSKRENVAADEIDEIVEALCVETRGKDLLAVHFTALATPCEILLASADLFTAMELGAAAAQEARRVERKFSHYRNDSVTAWIDHYRGSRINVERMLSLVRRENLEGRSPRLLLPAGGELDFGGIVKEYAVDRVYDLLSARRSAPFLVDFGGVLRANRAPEHGFWRVDIGRQGSEKQTPMMLDVEHGALATSGDSRRYLSTDGIRHTATLDPRTGCPVQERPRSVIVAASSCIKAGLLATLALLQGGRAREFLEEQGVRHWVLR
jgi:FAD:protein FMN transferase